MHLLVGILLFGNVSGISPHDELKFRLSSEYPCFTVSQIFQQIEKSHKLHKTMRRLKREHPFSRELQRAEQIIQDIGYDRLQAENE